MRAHILDTYYGEGKLDTQAADYPGFDGIYFKVSHANTGYLELSSTVGQVTRQIAEAAKDFKTVGIYHYPARNDVANWRLQADTYLRQCDLLNRAGLVVDYDVLDIERTFIVDSNGKFPKGHGSAMFEFYKYVVERTQRPFVLYTDPYAYNECFRFYGYTWQDELPWLVAQYPFRHWVSGLDLEAIGESRDPALYPQPADKEWIMWQYSDKFPAGAWMPGSQEADVNVWNGSVDDMLKYFGKNTEPEPPPPPPPAGGCSELLPGLNEVKAALERIGVKIDETSAMVDALIERTR